MIITTAYSILKLYANNFIQSSNKTFCSFLVAFRDNLQLCSFQVNLKFMSNNMVIRLEENLHAVCH